MSSTTSGPSASVTGSPSPTPPPLQEAEAHALAAVLAAEQAAVYAYGVVGGQASERQAAVALRDLQRHAARRDLVAGRLSAAGRAPAPAAAGYALPFPVDSPTTAAALAVHVEQAVAATNAALVASAAPVRRLEPARWLAENALAARRWGGEPTAFPGLPERA